MTKSGNLEWVPARPDDRTRDDFRPAPGQLESHEDFLAIARLEFGPRRNRWKWSGYRKDRAPHGFEGVCRSREDAARAAEVAYFSE